MPPSPHTRLVMGKHAECNCTTIKITLYESRASRVGTPMTAACYERRSTPVTAAGVPYRSLAWRDGRRGTSFTTGRRRIGGGIIHFHIHRLRRTSAGRGPRCEYRWRALSATAAAHRTRFPATAASDTRGRDYQRRTHADAVCRIPFFVTVALRCVSSRGARVVVTRVLSPLPTRAAATVVLCGSVSGARKCLRVRLR